MSTHSPQRPTDEPVDILLIEDNPGDARLTREAFRTTEYETTLRVITDGDDAVEFLARAAGNDAFPDLVLLDLNLPGRDGDEVLEAIRDDPRLSRLPVLVLTSSETPEDVARCYDASANAYLTKPTDPAEFSSLVETVHAFWFERVQLPPVPA